MGISIVIPVFNAENTIRKCLNSIFNQNYKEIEVICINDGSTDNSLSILNEYMSTYSNLKVISKQNEGPYIARVLGVEEASMEYITFIDSDDWIDEKYLFTLTSVIKKINPDILMFEYINDYSDGHTQISAIDLENKLYNKDEMNKKIFPLLMKDGYLNGLCNKVFKKSLFTNAIRKEFRYNYGEDLIYQLGLFDRANNLFFLPSSLYHYTHYRSDSLSNSNQSFDLLFSMYLIRKEYQIKWGLNEVFIDFPFVESICICMMSALKNIDIKSLLKLLLSNTVSNIFCRIKIDKRRLQTKNVRIVFTVLVHWFRFYQIIIYIYAHFLYGIKLLVIPIYELYLRSKLKNKDFSLLTSTCAGGIIYHRLGLQFRSPTINLWMTEPDLLKFVNDIDKYIDSSLVFIQCNEVNYPVAKLDDITIYFNHVLTKEDAEYQWNHRKNRINKDNLFILTSDYGLNYQDILNIEKIKCKGKIVFTSKDYKDLDYTLHLKYLEGKENVGEYMSDHTKYLDLFYWEKYFDFVYWLNTGIVRQKKNKDICLKHRKR